MQPRPLPLQHAGMRAGNLALVIGELAGHGPLTRAQLATRTGLTKSSVSGLVGDLMAGRLVCEGEPLSGGDRGRPGTVLTLDRQGAAGLGLEVNVDYLAAVIADLTGVPRYRHVVTQDNRGRAAADVLGELGELAATATRAAGEQQLELAGVCVAVPGVVSAGDIVRAPNLGWRDVPVRDAVADAVGRTPFGATIENEANLAALGELWFGEQLIDDRPLIDFVHVSGEIGIGGGLVVGGELFRGTHGTAGELGHIVVDSDGPACFCGGCGCLERLAGQEAIFAAAGVDSRQELERRCAAGDERALTAVADAGRWLGVALTSVTNVLDPGAVVLGGAFAALAAWLCPSVEQALAAHLGGSTVPQVLTSRLGPDAAVRGAAGSAVRQVIADPAGYLALQQDGVA